MPKKDARLGIVPPDRVTAKDRKKLLIPLAVACRKVGLPGAVVKTRDQRHDVLLGAQMVGCGPTLDVSIRNVSSRGMMIRAAAPPNVGAYIEIIADDVSAVGRVTWRNGTSFGVQTRE